MTEKQLKEFAKWCLDNGQHKLNKAEKEAMKLAIDKADSLDKLMQLALIALGVDSNR